MKNLLFVVLSLLPFNGCNFISSNDSNKAITTASKVVTTTANNVDLDSESDSENEVTPTVSRSSFGKPIHVRHAYSEHLENQAGNNYHPRNLLDANPSTAWALKLDTYYNDFNFVDGPYFEFNRPSRISGFSIQNGYCKNSNSFQNNTRAAWIKVYRVDPDLDGEFAEAAAEGYINQCDIIYEGPLRDTMEKQSFCVNPNFDNAKPTKAVALMFKDKNSHTGYFRGKKWNDLCISEIQFFE